MNFDASFFQEAFWLAFIISGLFAVLVLIIGYWYVNYKY